MFFTAETKYRQTTPTTRPSTSAPIGPANPEAGVTATRPATQPDAMPSIEGLPLKIHSANIHDSAAADVATNELIKAIGAPPVASRLEPALKPNQPTHSSEAPIMVMTSECGDISSLPKPTRLPTQIAPTRPAMPALMCTTVPPAKSIAPLRNKNPPSAMTSSSLACATFLAASSPAAARAFAAASMASGPDQYQTMCAIGKETKVTHSGMNSATAENFMRS